MNFNFWTRIVGFTKNKFILNMFIWPVELNCRFENKQQLDYNNQGYFYKESRFFC